MSWVGGFGKELGEEQPALVSRVLLPVTNLLPPVRQNPPT